VYLFVLSIEKGWITPTLRIWMGLGAGALCLLGSGPLRKRGYVVTGDALAGGGVVALYAATWAAHQLFGLVPVAVSFGGMIVITIGCSLLALRRSSQLIATLGLLGGFATPIALSSDRDNPIGLFGYVLLVNLGFLSVAHKRRWPALGIIGLLGTFVIEGLWIFGRMRGDTFWIALVALAVFALLFVVFTALQPSSERARWAVSQVGALLCPSCSRCTSCCRRMRGSATTWCPRPCSPRSSRPAPGGWRAARGWRSCRWARPRAASRWCSCGCCARSPGPSACGSSRCAAPAWRSCSSCTSSSCSAARRRKPGSAPRASRPRSRPG
jgi:uncharacterized membrane protein